MKHWTIACYVACVLVAAMGCERRQPLEKPRAYDASTDPPPSMTVLEVDPNLAADQTKVAAAMAAAMAAARPRPVATPSTSPAATTQPAAPTPGTPTPGTSVPRTTTTGPGLPPVLPGEPGAGT